MVFGNKNGDPEGLPQTLSRESYRRQSGDRFQAWNGTNNALHHRLAYSRLNGLLYGGLNRLHTVVTGWCC